TDFDFIKKNLEKEVSKEITINKVIPNQSVRLNDTVQNITAALPNNEKILEYAKYAHTQTIKKMAVDITAHFGDNNFSKEINSKEDLPDTRKNAKTPIPISTYRELKKNRSEKIGNFTLNSDEDEESKGKKPFEVSHKKIDIKNLKEEYKNDEENDDECFFEEPDDAKKYLKNKMMLSKISLFATMLTAVIAVIFAFFKPVGDTMILFEKLTISTNVYVSINLVLLALAALFSFEIYKNALISLVQRDPNKDILYTFATIIMFVANLLITGNDIANNGANIFTPVFVVSLFFNRLVNYWNVKQASQNYDYISNNSELYNVSKVEGEQVLELTKGLFYEEEAQLFKNVKTKNIQKFITNSFKSDKSDDVCFKTAVAMIPVSIVFGILTYFLLKNMSVALTVMSITLLLSTSFIAPMLVTFPLKDSSKMAKHFAGMTPCKDAVEQLSEANSVLLDAYDIFPKGTVKLRGIKTFSGNRIDEAILNAASVLCECKSILSHLFLEIIAENKNMLKKVDTIVYEDLMGISAWVDNKRVLIGNRELMINHSIPVPKKEYEDKINTNNQEMVYLATEGELCAGFIVAMTTKKGIYDSLSLLERNDVKAIIKSVDSILTSDKLSYIFGIQEESFKIIPSRLHAQYKNEIKEIDDGEILIGNNGNILGYIISLVTAKKVTNCVYSGMILNFFAMAVGIVLMAACCFLGKLQLITNLSLLMYLSIFYLLYYIYQKNIRF
ncbi:MAG: hypothetical protein RSE93_04540, partial [Oscillospiraceae bacterium]